MVGFGGTWGVLIGFVDDLLGEVFAVLLLFVSPKKWNNPNTAIIRKDASPVKRVYLMPRANSLLSDHMKRSGLITKSVTLKIIPKILTRMNLNEKSLVVCGAIDQPECTDYLSVHASDRIFNTHKYYIV